MTEKRKPTYELSAIKDAFSSVARLRERTTSAAMKSAVALGFDHDDVVETIQTIDRGHFMKSMTSHADYRIWQDVYHVPSWAGVLYVKFTESKVTEFVLLSFKERNHG